MVAQPAGVLPGCTGLARLACCGALNVVCTEDLLSFLVSAELPWANAARFASGMLRASATTAARAGLVMKSSSQYRAFFHRTSFNYRYSTSQERGLFTQFPFVRCQAKALIRRQHHSEVVKMMCNYCRKRCCRRCCINI